MLPRSFVMAVLALDGVLVALATALLLPSYLGSIPFPVSALIGGLVNAALVWAALHWAPSLRRAALPLWTWMLTVVVMTFGGPGGDLIFAGHDAMAFGILVMLVLGTAPPLWVLWRRQQVLRTAAAMPGESVD